MTQRSSKKKLLKYIVMFAERERCYWVSGCANTLNRALLSFPLERRK